MINESVQKTDLSFCVSGHILLVRHHDNGDAPLMIKSGEEAMIS